MFQLVTPRHNTGCTEKRPREEDITSTNGLLSFSLLRASSSSFLSLFLHSLSFRPSRSFIHLYIHLFTHTYTALPPLPFLFPSTILYYDYSFFSGFLRFLEFPLVVGILNVPSERPQSLQCGRFPEISSQNVILINKMLLSTVKYL